MQYFWRDEREERAIAERQRRDERRRAHLLRKYGTDDPAKVKALRAAANNGFFAVAKKRM